MKRLGLLITLAILLCAPSAWAASAGTVTQSLSAITNAPIRILTFTAVGSADDGSIPDTATSAAITTALTGYYLYTVTANPGATAPDAADVFLLDAAGEDLLGSVDGGTTANKGANLIHATLTKTTMPYTHYLSQHYFPLISGAVTLRVSNQATVSATYTITLVFVR